MLCRHLFYVSLSAGVLLENPCSSSSHCGWAGLILHFSWGAQALSHLGHISQHPSHLLCLRLAGLALVSFAVASASPLTGTLLTASSRLLLLRSSQVGRRLQGPCPHRLLATSPRLLCQLVRLAGRAYTRDVCQVLPQFFGRPGRTSTMTHSFFPLPQTCSRQDGLESLVWAVSPSG